MSKLSKAKGLTFIEIIFALFILTAVLVGFSQIFSTAILSGKRAQHEMIAINLASGLMTEIMSKAFEDPATPIFGKEAGEIYRYDFNDIDDYHNLSEAPPKTVGKPADGGYLDMDGTAGTIDFSTYTRSVAVSYAAISGSDVIDVAGPTDLKKVTVTVSGPFGKDLSIVQLKARP